MKKNLKIVALLSAVVILAVSLCSCGALDNARAYQAFYNGSNRNEILYGDHVYKYIASGSRELIFTDLYGQDRDSAFYVTEEDVPVLLASREGEYFQLNADKTLLFRWGVGDNVHIWYVRDDLYEKYENALNNAELDSYFYSYQEYPDDDPYGAVKQVNLLLGPEMTDIIDRAYSISKDKRVSYKQLSEDPYWIKTVILNRCDKDMLVMNSTSMTLVKDGVSYYVWDGNTYEENVLCPINDKDIPTVKAFFKNNPDSVNEYNIRYEFDSYDYY